GGAGLADLRGAAGAVRGGRAADPDPVGFGDDGTAGADRDLAGGIAGAAADAVRGGDRTGRGGRVPDADRAPRQPADPGPGAVPLRRLPPRRPAAHRRHRPRQRLARPMALAPRAPAAGFRLKAKGKLTRITRIKADKRGSKCNGSRQPASSPRTTTALSVLIGFYPRYPCQKS